MNAALIEFSNDIHQLKKYIGLLKSQSRLVKSALSSNTAVVHPSLEAFADRVVQLRLDKQTYEYSSIIVSLYGCLEDYIEEIVITYLENLLQLRGNYEKLPEHVKKKHTSLTLKYITEGRKYWDISESDVEEAVANLHSCLSNSGNAKINLLPFAYHTANMRVKTIDRLFNAVGIEAASKKALNSVFIESSGTIHPDYSTRNEAIIPVVNDLSERRNEVSHGSIGSTLSLDILGEYIDIIWRYGISLYMVVSESLLPDIISGVGRELGSPIAVYDNRIVCVNSLGIPFRRGDYLLFSTNDDKRPFRAGVVAEIQIDGTPQALVPVDKSVDLGLRILDRAKGNYDVHYAAREVLNFRVAESEVARFIISQYSRSQ